TDKEIARLEGQLLMAASNQATGTNAPTSSNETLQTRWEIDGEQYSLAELDSAIAEKQNRSRFFGFPLRIKTIHLIPSGSEKPYSRQPRSQHPSLAESSKSESWLLPIHEKKRAESDLRLPTES